MKKFIATILIFGLILISLPKPAQAVADVIGGPWQPPATIKELLLDTIGHTITQTILGVLKQKIMDWGHGRKSDAMQPFQVSDWVEYFKDAIALGAAKWITQEFEQVFDTADEFQRNMKNTLDSLGFGTYAQDLLTYSQYARPTLQDDLGNRYQGFVDSGYSLGRGGWDAWFSMMKPQNNIFGQVLMAERARRTAEEQEKEAADKETAVSSGVKNETAATQTDIEACRENCEFGNVVRTSDEVEACQQQCENRPGMVLKKTIKNWGSDIHGLMTKSLGADIDRLISVDELTELMGVLFSALVNKAVNMGLAFGTSIIQPSSSQRARAKTKTQFSYQRVFKKEQTTEDIKDVRSQTLSNILKSMQQLSRSITTCKDEELMKYDDYVKNLDDIFSPSVEALYIGLEGVNLKPDYEVLDPPFAPYTVYGYSWDEVPASKFPDKCKGITDQLNLGANATCRSIRSGLEPRYSTNCERCMYDHDSLNCPPAPYPPQPYPKTGQPDPWASETLMKQKSDFWWNCKNQYNQTIDRCDECLKKADEKCNQLDGEQKNQCILAICGNYSDIGGNIRGTIADGLDFYNKCLIEEKKEACYTCEKEYFMPANYCGETHDYMARSIMKYPALVKKVRTGFLKADHEIWLGIYDKTTNEQLGGECNNNDDKDDLDLSVICRIMPDFTYAGERVCETRCSQAGLTGQALTDALKDITDFRPHGKDCGNLKLPIGGKGTHQPVSDGVFHTRAKCCGALWQNDPEKYAICVGAGATAASEPEETKCGTGQPLTWEPWCFCPEGWRPLSRTRTRTGGLAEGRTSPGGDCDANSFTNTNNNRSLLVYTNNDPWSDTYFIGRSACTETQPDVHNVDQNKDGVIDGPSNPTDASAPASMLWSAIPHANVPVGEQGRSSGDSRDKRPHEYWCVNPNNQGMQTNTEYNYGVFHNNWDDLESVITVCAPCNSNDLNYNNATYNIKDGDGNLNDQCYNKHPNTLWLDDANDTCR